MVGSMTPILPMCIERRGATVASLGDTVTLIGGADASSTDRAATRDVESWNGAQRLQFGRLAIPRGIPTATALADGSMLVAGGLNGNDSSTAVRELELGSPAGPRGSVTWQLSGSLSAPRWGHTATLLADGAGVMIAGGGNETDNPVGSVELWRNGRVTLGGPLDTPRVWHTATLLIDGRVLVVGGWGSGQVLSSVEIYDPAARTTRAAAPLLTPRRGHTATLLADGRVLVVGGQMGSEGRATLASTEIFDPRTGAWTVASTLPLARTGHTAVVLRDGRVLVAGGVFWFGHDWWTPRTVDTLEIWAPATDTWSLAGRFASPEVAMTALSSEAVMLVGPEDGWGQFLSATWRP
jgi:hypothetical protein